MTTARHRDHTRANDASDDIHRSLSVVMQRIHGAIDRAHTPGPSVDGYPARHSAYDAPGGGGALVDTDDGDRVLVELTAVEAAADRAAFGRPQPDPVRTTVHDAMRWLDRTAREAGRIAQRLEQLGAQPRAEAEPPRPCAHCNLEDRYRGDLGRRCYDWRASHAGQLPNDDVIEAWRRGKQPKVRVG